MTSLSREVLHAQWDIFIDGEFLEAYEHGIVIHVLRWDNTTVYILA